MNLKNIFLTVFFSYSFILSAAKKDKELQTIDREYEENIKTVLLYPSSLTVLDSALITDAIIPPIMPLNDSRQLLLSFDELGSTTKNYYVRILNCNSDWTLSNLNAILFMTDYDEFQIMDRQTSYSTRVPYIHYKFNVPKPKISGNFLIMVYRDGDDQDLILTRRFMIYETNIITITPAIKFPVNNSLRNTGQQADFTLAYNSSIQNPADNITVVLRQNYNWYNAIYGLKPLYMRDEISTFDYTLFNNENVFKGVNEFRFFDLRSLKSNGMNVASIVQSPNKNDVILEYDKSRNKSAYGTYSDIDGFYAPEQYETKGYETEPDYAKVSFTLDMKQEDAPAGRIFVMGALTDWSLNSNFEMKWDPDNKFFRCTVLIKQGYYNYRYVVLPKEGSAIDDTILEGNSSQTENFYDWIVYYRGPGGMYDRIVGYKATDYLANH
ncbi:MAG TPA: DUF5103 domain-containing protein [Cytophagaceae bacterium]|jgi:hypothetical protein|nr:DUF5103 domain-containing protein [Cytophagaceae bacterium]